MEATAEYAYGHPNVLLTYYDVIKWDKDILIATSSSGICMTNTVLVSFGEKRITATDAPKDVDEKKKESCKFFGAAKTLTWNFVLFGSSRGDKEEYGVDK